MKYSELTKEQLESRLEKAYNKVSKLRTQGGLWAMQGEIKACKKALKDKEDKVCIEMCGACQNGDHKNCQLVECECS